VTIITDVPQSGPPNPSNWPPWASWFKQVFLTCFSVQDSGTTAQRPSNLPADQSKLWVGRRYFDTTIDQPVWYDGTTWVTWSTGGGGQGNIQIQDDGVDVGTAGQYTTYNFGVGISATQTTSTTVTFDASLPYSIDPARGQILEGWGGYTSSGTTGPMGNGVVVQVGSLSGLDPVPGSLFTQYYRSRFSSSSAGQPAGFTQSRALNLRIYTLGTGGVGGFYLYNQSIIGTALPSNTHMLCGVTDYNSGSVTVEPNSLANTQGAAFFGFGADAADTNWQIVRAGAGGTGYTKVDTGLAKTTTGIYAWTISCLPSASSMECSMSYLDSSGTAHSVVANSSFSTNIPASSANLQAPFQFVSSGNVLNIDWIYARTFLPFPVAIP